MEDALKVAVEKTLSEYFPNIQELSPQHIQILKSVLVSSKDTFAVLPTGHGMSLPFQIAPKIAKEISSLRPILNNKDIVLVISPFLAIMEVQVKQLKDSGISACCLHDETVNQTELLSGDFSIVFGTPEAWLRNENWQKTLRSPTYQKRVLLLVADKAHCVPNW